MGENLWHSHQREVIRLMSFWLLPCRRKEKNQTRVGKRLRLELTSFDSMSNSDLFLSQSFFVSEMSKKRKNHQYFANWLNSSSSYFKRLFDIRTSVCIAFMTFGVSSERSCCSGFTFSPLLLFQISLFSSNTLQLQFLEYAICRILWIEFVLIIKEKMWMIETKTNQKQNSQKQFQAELSSQFFNFIFFSSLDPVGSFRIKTKQKLTAVCCKMSWMCRDVMFS